LPPVTTLAPFFKASAMCASTFSTAFMSISGPITARLEPVGDLHRPGGLSEALGEGVVDAVLHQKAVGAHAGLAGVAVFRGDRAFDCHHLRTVGFEVRVPLARYLGAGMTQ
jgi:hypothetical protein